MATEPTDGTRPSRRWPSTPASRPIPRPAPSSPRSTRPPRSPSRGVGEHQGYEYSRSGNPTRTALETCLAALEGAAHGSAFASGLAAEDAVLRLLEPGRPRAHRQRRLRRHVPPALPGARTRRSRVRLRLPSHDPGSGRLAAWQPNTRMVWVETPSNPLLRIADIAALAELAHGRGALLVVDNTFATPYLQHPLALGADVVVHSTTKYLGGHSDVVGGFVATSDRRSGRADRLPPERRRGGPGPFRLLPRPPRHQDARRPDGPPLRQRQPRWPRCWRHIRVGGAGLLPGPTGARRPRHGAATDAALRGNGLLHRARRGGAGAWPSPRPPRSSPWPSPSAPSSPSLSTPHRMTHASLAGSSAGRRSRTAPPLGRPRERRRPRGRPAVRTRGRPPGLEQDHEREAGGRFRWGYDTAWSQPPTDVTQAWATAGGCSCLAVTSRFSFEMATVVSLASMALIILATPGVSTEVRITGTM